MACPSPKCFYAYVVLLGMRQRKDKIHIPHYLSHLFNLAYALDNPER